MTMNEFMLPAILAGTSYRLFISHAWNGRDSDYYGLVNLLNGDQSFRWSNYSVAQHAPLQTNNNRDLSLQLRSRIKACNCFLIITGMYVAHRDWIQHEIDIARTESIPIIGVKPWGQERVPTDLQNICRQIVGWNASSVISAIKGTVLYGR